MNIGVRTSFQIRIFIFFRYIVVSVLLETLSLPLPYHWPWTSKLPQTLWLQELNASNTHEREEICTSPVEPPEETPILAGTWLIALGDPEQGTS